MIPSVCCMKWLKDYKKQVSVLNSYKIRNMQKKSPVEKLRRTFFSVRNSDFKKVKGLNLLYHAFIMVIVYHASLQNVCILFK